MAAVGDYADGTGPAPEELVDDFLAQRYGWTFSALDEEDMSRVLPAVAAANIYAAYSRVMPALDGAAMSGDPTRLPRAEDVKTYMAVKKAQDERDA